MDTRERPEDRFDRRVTVPPAGEDAEVVDLNAVRPIGRAAGAGRFALPVMIATVAVAAAYLAAATNVPGPEPSPSPVSVATQVPTEVAVVPTPKPTVYAPTPTPEPVPTPTPAPWHWTRTEFDPRISLADVGAWGVGDRVLVLVHQSGRDRDPWVFARLTPAVAPETFAAPRGIGELSGGTVIGNRLWFLVRIGDRDTNRGEWQLMGTADGESWTSPGVAEGLDDVAGASFIGRVGGTWVAAVWRKGTGGTGAPTPQDLRWSADGVHWRTSSLSERNGVVSYGGAAMLGGTMVILGRQWFDFEDETHFILTSTDGRTWRESPLDPPATGRPDELVCGQGSCILTFRPNYEEQLSPSEMLMLSTDGADWAPVTVDVPSVDEDSRLTDLRATSTGFMATTGLRSPVWLSGDGISWSSVDVLPPDTTDSFSEFAVAGDLVVGISETSSELATVIWTGSVSTTAAFAR